MTRTWPTTRFLASVRSVEEARLAVAAGADFIDCKDPSSGALGALPVDIVRAIRAAVPAGFLVSATVGDLVPEPETLKVAVAGMAATGVDFVKIGFFPGGDAAAAIRALAPPLFHPARLVGLLLADRDPDFDLISVMGNAGFAGVMVDTAGKSSGALPSVISPPRLKSFIDAAHREGLFAGLAGSLRLNHVAELLVLQPDLLGFRGALCRAGERTGALDFEALMAVRGAIPGAPVPEVLQQKVLL